MSVQKRRCVTCKHFADAQMSGNGWCTHPKRQISSDVRILVRKGELACRNSWGGDLWESVGAQEPTPLRKTQIPDSAFVMNERSEDEVTSVRAAHHEPDTSDRVVFSDPSFRQADQEDVIVDHASISRDETSRDIRSTQRHGLADDDGLNTPAQEEQHERAQVIARGSRDAILRARERHTQRRRGTDRIQPRLLSDGAGVPDDQEDASQPAWFAEEEPQPKTPLSESDTPNAVTSEPQHITDPMARRFGRRAHIRQESLGASSSEQSISIAFTRARDDAAPVPPSETPPDPMHLVSRKVDRERFETVPEVKPTIGLPRIREFLQSGDTSPDGQESTTTAEARPGSVSSYDLVLRRAQAIKSASKTERGARPGRAITTSPAPTAPATSRTVRRERVNHLPQINWDHEPDAGDPPFTAARLPDLETEPVVSGRRERHASSVDLEPVEVRHPDEPDDEWLEDGLDDEQTYTGALPEDDHSRSWWRGLNFTRSRREPESPAIEIVDDDDAYEREWIAAGEDADSFADADSFGDPSPPAITAPRESVAARSVQSRPISSAGRGVSRVATQESPGDSSIRQERISASHRLEQSLDDNDTGRIDVRNHVVVPEAGVTRQRVPRSSRPLSPVEHDSRRSGRGDRNRDGGAASAAFSLQDKQGMDAFRSALFQPDDEDEAGLATQVRQSPSRGGSLRGRQDHQRRGETAVTSPSRGPRQTSYQPLEEASPEPDTETARAHEDHWYETDGEPEFDIRNLVARQDDLLDMTVSLAPDLPRTCQTCRDFRQSESGGGGWCTNEFAFTHRQMVNADSLPCRSSIGCWWLPYDVSWLPALVPAERHPATPRTDRLVASARLESADRTAETQDLYVREI